MLNVLLAFTVQSSALSAGFLQSTPADIAFRAFIRNFEKSYDTTEERLQRFVIFADNLRFIEMENGQNNGYTLGVNEFADLTPEEFKGKFLGLNEAPVSGALLGEHQVSCTDCLPEEVDWTTTASIPGGDIKGYRYVNKSTLGLMDAVARQPVSIAIEADPRIFQLYKSGILTSKQCGSSLGHSAIAVGYGVDAGAKYWKVKNSFGTKWGEDGMVRLARDDGSDECGILNGPPLYPVVTPTSEVTFVTSPLSSII